MNFLKKITTRFSFVAILSILCTSSAFATGATVTIATTAAIPALSRTMFNST